MSAATLQFPQGPVVDPTTGYVSLEWQQWFLNPQILTINIGTAIGVTSGGTGITSYVLGDTLFASAANTLAKLGGNTTSTKKFLSQTGTGTVSAAPVWSAISGGDVTGAALTEGNDTNVTLTLGGSPTTALLNAASITAGWTGTLSTARGGTGNGTGTATAVPVGGITGLGTGVGTALTVNVGTAGSFIVNGGALGTPSSGVATNLTGTAASLTAGTVTTNANLTGPITSSGNATTIASQTGTGTKFVVDNTPTLITPVLGAATATSINFGQTTFNFYQEGTWTPIDSSGAGLTLSTVDGTYTRTGRMTISGGSLAYPVTVNASTALVGGLPFTVKNTESARQGFITYDNGLTNLQAMPAKNTTTVNFANASTGSFLTNAQVSGSTIYFTAAYPV